MTHQNITSSLIGVALQHIPANLPRDEWARVGMAIKSEFPDEAGRDLFIDWSATADSFDAKAAKSTWQSIKAGGGVGIGTLLHLAKENGFVLPQGNQAPSKPDPATAARLASERAARQQEEQVRQQATHEAAALEAGELWDSASETGESGYLTRKLVLPYGVRFGADGWLLVPVHDASGKLWNLQRIAPDKPASGSDKLFLKGGRKSGLWHWCGDPADATVLLICEGYQSDSAMENTFRVKGTAEQWRERVGVLCAGNSRLVFAVACAFAGPLLRPAGMESGGFHYRGDSSSGKTTALKLAASVYGGASYLQRWRSTDNALEATAAQSSDCLLVLDELAQIDPKTAGECAYMLANEQGKARATRTGTPRARQTWRLLFLSAGELSLSDHMAEGQKRTRTGQETRMADISADAGAGLGAFENLHGYEGGAAFAKHITHQAQAVYGASGRAWLQWCTANADTLKATTRNAADALAASMIPKDCSGQVERVGARFALVGAAGEMATAAGLTGWELGESEQAARACFSAWLAARGGTGNGEVVAMLRAVRRFLEAHGEGRFTWWHRGADDRNAKTLHRAGHRRMVGSDGSPIKSNSDHQREYGDYMPPDLGADVSVEYFILPEVFRSEVCQGFDYLAVCRVLLDHHCITPEYKPAPDADKVKRYDTNHRLPGVGLSRCYRITPAIFALDL